MSRVCVFLADGFEEIEGLTVVDLLRRAGVETQTVSVKDVPDIMGSHRIALKADVCIKDADFSDTEMLVLPGGMPGTLHLGECKALTDLLLSFAESGKKARRSPAAQKNDGSRKSGCPISCFSQFPRLAAAAPFSALQTLALGIVTAGEAFAVLG